MKNLFLLVALYAQTLFAQNPIAWQTPMPIASASFGNLHPRVVVDAAGNPLVIWGNSNSQGVYFARWNGNGFSTPMAVNGSISIFAASWAGPDLAAHGDTVYVVFKQTPEHVNPIFLTHSYDGGVNFSAPVQVDNIGDYLSRFPSVATDSLGNPLVAFMKFDPGFENARYVVARSEDFGSSFLPDTIASKYSSGDVCDCCPASIISDGNRVATLYRDNLNNLRNSWAGISTDGGQSFPAGIPVDKTNWMINSCPSSGPDGIIVGDSLYSVFMSAATGSARCYWSKSSLGSLQSSASIRLTNNLPGLSQQNYPRIANDGTATAITWVQTVSNAGQLALRFTNDISAGFAVGFDTVAMGSIANADVALGKGVVYVVWEDENSGQVFYRKGNFSTSGVTNLVQNMEVEITPNPVSGEWAQATLPGKITAQVAYKIYDVEGKIMRAGSAEIQESTLQIDLTALQKGIYWLSIECEGRLYNTKIVKQ